MPRDVIHTKLGIVALVPDRWEAVDTTRHMILERMAERCDVAWLEPSLGWRDHWLPASDAAPRAEPHAPKPHSDRLRVYASDPLLPQVFRPAALGRWLLRQRVEGAARQLRRRGAKRLVLYLWRPEFAAALDARGFDLSCYHIDDDYSFSAVEQPTGSQELALIRRVDQVIVHSARLMRRKGQINPRTAIVPNGVDYQAYTAPHPPAADLAAVPRPRIGYVGVVKKQLDLALMLELARCHPQWSFVFVGPVGALGEKAPIWLQLLERQNVFALGSRSAGELPAYSQHFDVNTMCYEVNDYTNTIFPLKLNEYLAAGRPVVSSPVETVLGFGHVVTLASGVDEWASALAAALAPEANTPAAVAARRAVAKDYDWTLLVDRIEALFTAPGARQS
jgi:glycosyltransferase involved in cell wall biosynthesis